MKIVDWTKEPQSSVDLLNKIFAMSPDELLLKIAECKKRYPAEKRMLDALVSGFRAVCDIRLAEILGSIPPERG